MLKMHEEKLSEIVSVYLSNRIAQNKSISTALYVVRYNDSVEQKGDPFL